MFETNWTDRKVSFWLDNIWKGWTIMKFFKEWNVLKGQFVHMLMMWRHFGWVKALEQNYILWPVEYIYWNLQFVKPYVLVIHCWQACIGRVKRMMFLLMLSSVWLGGTTNTVILPLFCNCIPLKRNPCTEVSVTLYCLTYMALWSPYLNVEGWGYTQKIKSLGSAQLCRTSM